MGRYRVTKKIEFCYGHRLINYEGKCRNLHGHNAVVEVDIDAAELDALGMVIDFGEIKARLAAWIDAHLDHQLLLCERDPLLAPLRAHDQRIFVMAENPTAENIARVIFDAAKGAGLPVAEVRLWETPSSCAGYRCDES